MRAARTFEMLTPLFARKKSTFPRAACPFQRLETNILFAHSVLRCCVYRRKRASPLDEATRLVFLLVLVIALLLTWAAYAGISGWPWFN
jgi:hypothetical protein